MGGETGQAAYSLADASLALGRAGAFGSRPVAVLFHYLEQPFELYGLRDERMVRRGPESRIGRKRRPRAAAVPSASMPSARFRE